MYKMEWWMSNEQNTHTQCFYAMLPIYVVGFFFEVGNERVRYGIIGLLSKNSFDFNFEMELKKRGFGNIEMLDENC